MQNNQQDNGVSAEALRRGHEAADPHLRNVLIVGASVMAMIVFSLGTAGILIHVFSQNRPMHSMQSLGLISAPGLQPLERFPEPNLQLDDDHLEHMRLIAEQNQILNSYGWVDRSNGIVRIPIERAMALLAERGLPTRTNSRSSTGVSPLELIQERAKQR
jgi:hypothetical protein